MRNGRPDLFSCPRKGTGPDVNLGPARRRRRLVVLRCARENEAFFVDSFRFVARGEERRGNF
jgi:hypothetical protein